jgi:acyl carrier protein
MAKHTSLYDQIDKLFLEKLNRQVPSIDTDLLETGFLDSLAFVELLAHLEQEFGMEICLDDIEVDSLRSITKIAEFVAKRK